MQPDPNYAAFLAYQAQQAAAQQQAAAVAQAPQFTPAPAAAVQPQSWPQPVQPAAVPQATQVAVPPAVQSAPPTGGKTPGIRHLEGRLIVLMPKSSAPEVDKFNAGKMVTGWVADLIILDGGPLRFGDDLTKGTPATHEVLSTPVLIRGFRDSHKTIGNLMAGCGIGGAVIGRVIKTQGTNNTYWNLEPVSGTGAEEQAYGDFWTGMHSGRIVNPEVTPIPGVVVPQQAAAQPAVDPAYAAFLASQRQQVAAVPQPPAQPAVDPAYAAWLASQQPAAPAAPAGWDPAVWATLPAQMQAQVMAQYSATVGQPAGV